MIWEILFLLIFAGLVVLLDRDIDPYPPPLPRSIHPRRTIITVICLWVMALVVNGLRLLMISPFLQKMAIQPVISELIYLPIISLPFLLLPLFLNNQIDHHPLSELGLTWKTCSKGVTIFAVSFGAISGAVAFWTGETVVGVTALSLGTLILLIFNNAFLEEFFYRGVIQTKIERILGQKWSVFFSGLIFASTHLVLDVLILGGENNLGGVLYALLMQILGGWLLGLIFVKTRTLWPGVICHYLINWLPSILTMIVGYSI
jgi:membrane protease YdiL (CAAX protease family)